MKLKPKNIKKDSIVKKQGPGKVFLSKDPTDISILNYHIDEYDKERKVLYLTDNDGNFSIYASFPKKSPKNKNTGDFFKVIIDCLEKNFYVGIKKAPDGKPFEFRLVEDKIVVISTKLENDVILEYDNNLTTRKEFIKAFKYLSE